MRAVFSFRESSSTGAAGASTRCKMTLLSMAPFAVISIGESSGMSRAWSPTETRRLGAVAHDVRMASETAIVIRPRSGTAARIRAKVKDDELFMGVFVRFLAVVALALARSTKILPNREP